MATHYHKSEGNGEKLREEHELVVHDGGREDGHNDDAINDSRGSGNMVVMGETHDARPEHMPGVPGVL